MGSGAGSELIYLRCQKKWVRVGSERAGGRGLIGAGGLTLVIVVSANGNYHVVGNNENFSERLLFFEFPLYYNYMHVMSLKGK